jgi:hypothetical protein
MSLAALSEHDLAHWRSTARRAQGAIQTRLFIDGQFVDGYTQTKSTRFRLASP